MYNCEDLMAATSKKYRSYQVAPGNLLQECKPLGYFKTVVKANTLYHHTDNT